VSTLEIVHLRGGVGATDSLSDRIRDSLREGGHSHQVVTLYRRRGLNTDVAVHLRHGGPPGIAGGSALAIHVAHALKEFGLVEHSVWEEVES
jgi:hypothetical protein